MPVRADPSAHDPSAPHPPSTPPRLPMLLTLPGSPLLLSPVATPAGQPTPVSLPVPASLLKMHLRQGSSLFTPNASAPATPDHPIRTDRDAATVSKTSYFEMQDEDTGVEQSQNAKELLQPAAMVDDPSADLGTAIEQTDPVVEVQEELTYGQQHAVPEAELQQSTSIEEISTGVASEEIHTEPTETVEEALPQDDESAAAPDQESTVTAELIDLPSRAEEMDDQVVVIESEATSSVPHEEDHGASFSPNEISSTLDAAGTSASNTVPLPDLADGSPPPVEHHQPMGRDESEAPSPAAGDEEKADVDDEIAAVTSDNDAGDSDEMLLQYPSESDVQVIQNSVGDVDEMVLQYPFESDVKAAADVEVEEQTISVDAGDDNSEESETDADGDDDPDHEDSSSASSVIAEVDVGETVDKKSEELVANAASDEPSSPTSQDSTMKEEKVPADFSGPRPEADVIFLTRWKMFKWFLHRTNPQKPQMFLRKKTAQQSQGTRMRRWSVPARSILSRFLRLLPTLPTNLQTTSLSIRRRRL
ncbi:hypothetical protein B0H17DRAFT_711685 [Mycena rosella]|uniref:Uncharacterized protein n=1 Tax=Mycena rosella TaxID=1033263 RepID=A0AAD7GDY9_MYCRO|nr:hypothetical protein B0H17DRAFT_711685 [Mycena rosella]